MLLLLLAVIPAMSIQKSSRHTSKSFQQLRDHLNRSFSQHFALSAQTQQVVINNNKFSINNNQNVTLTSRVCQSVDQSTRALLIFQLRVFSGVVKGLLAHSGPSSCSIFTFLDACQVSGSRGGMLYCTEHTLKVFCRDFSGPFY